MRVTFKQLEAFVAVANTGSFSSAAQAIHTSQPALSALIQNLEAQLGVVLFERGARGVAITTTGRELLPSVKRLLNELNETIAGVMDATTPPGGIVTLACIPSVAAVFMPPLIARFQQECPYIRIEMRDAMVENHGVLDMLRAGEIDFGVASPQDAEHLQFRFLFEDTLVAIVSDRHKFAGRQEVTWSELVSEPLIGMSRNSYIRQLTDGAFAKIGVSQHPYATASLITTAVGMSKNGLGIAILPDAAASVCSQEGVVLLKLLEPVVTRPIGFLYRSMTSLSPAAKAFMRFVEHALAQPFRSDHR